MINSSLAVFSTVAGFYLDVSALTLASNVDNDYPTDMQISTFALQLLVLCFCGFGEALRDFERF